MLTLSTSQIKGLRLEWEVTRGRTCVLEDFEGGEVWVVMRNRRGGYVVPVDIEERERGGHVLKGVLPVVAAGVYDFRCLWYKVNGRHVDDTVPHTTSKLMVSEVFDALLVSDTAPRVEQASRLRLRSSAVTYGYDGLSAWERAVVMGKTTLSEEQWVGDIVKMNARLMAEERMLEDWKRETRAELEARIRQIEAKYGGGGGTTGGTTTGGGTGGTTGGGNIWVD